MDLELLGAHAPAGCTVEIHADPSLVTWSISNEGSEPVAVDRVVLRWRATGGEPTHMFRHGWQSWSPSGGGTVPGRQPSQDPDVSWSRSPIHGAFARSPSNQGRSSLVTVVADPEDALCLGFDGGDRHDCVFHVDGPKIVAEALLGGAVLQPGERRELHTVRIERGDPASSLRRWATWAGRRARVDAGYRVGWCSWYQYFHGVTEDAVRDNLSRAGDWRIEVFQLDDGYQAAIGEWLRCSEAFPSALERIAGHIAAAGFTPGIWLAPFLVSPTTGLSAEPTDRIMRRPSGDPVVGMVNPAWGGEQHVLDTTHPEVLSHLESLARALTGMGWRYLKLDFTYAPALAGRAHDPTRTPAERVRLGYDAIRRGAGDDVFILGCGAPLGPCIGVVDGMRIGPDVAPYWAPRRSVAGGGDDAPAMRNAWRNTLARSFMHRRLWLNDPDCVLLRTAETQLTDAQRRAWAYAVAVSGGMVVVSDDLGLLGRDARDLLDEALAIGKEVDDASASDAAPVCADLLERWTPTTLDAGFVSIVGDPERGTAKVARRH